MNRLGTKLLLGGAMVLGSMTLLAAEASAQATRTWISGVGDDVNPCSRTAPCKTFAGAISKTAAGGEINCIDPAGFGAVTITKSISLICSNVENGILVSSGNGINVNAGVNDVVVLDGFDLEGFGSGNTGIRVNQVGAVHIRNSQIRDFRGSNGAGIAFVSPNAGAKLYVTDTTVSENGSAGQGAGIVIAPTAASGTSQVVLSNVKSLNNPNGGIRIDTTGTNGQTVSVSVLGGDYSLNGAGIAALAPSTSTSQVVVLIDGANITNNVGQGIVTNGPNVVARVANTNIANNTSFGVLAALPGAGKGILTFTPATNHLVGNGTDGTFSGTVASQ